MAAPLRSHSWIMCPPRLVASTSNVFDGWKHTRSIIPAGVPAPHLACRSTVVLHAQWGWRTRSQGDKQIGCSTLHAACMGVGQGQVCVLGRLHVIASASVVSFHAKTLPSLATAARQLSAAMRRSQTSLDSPLRRVIFSVSRWMARISPPALREQSQTHRE